MSPARAERRCPFHNLSFCELSDTWLAESAARTIRPLGGPEVAELYGNDPIIRR
jgi:hypothetical protein